MTHPRAGQTSHCLEAIDVMLAEKPLFYQEFYEHRTHNLQVLFRPRAGNLAHPTTRNSDYRSFSVPSIGGRGDGLSPDQQALVEEARQRLSAAFGAAAVIRVHRSNDPAEPEAAPITFVTATVKMEPDQAMAIMDRLDDEWWLDQLPRAEGRVNISFEHGRQ